MAGADTFSAAGGAVSDLFSAFGSTYKVKGYQLEQDRLNDAATFADENEKYTETSYAIKQMQLDRSIYQSQSGTQADTAGAGLAMSGSALDILHDSASQGALTKQVTQQQGYITEAGYREQAKSLRDQAEAAGVAAQGAEVAGIGSAISGVLKGVGVVASLGLAPLTGGLSLAAIPAVAAL